MSEKVNWVDRKVLRYQDSLKQSLLPNSCGRGRGPRFLSSGLPASCYALRTWKRPQISIFRGLPASCYASCLTLWVVAIWNLCQLANPNQWSRIANLNAISHVREKRSYMAAETQSQSISDSWRTKTMMVWNRCATGQRNVQRYIKEKQSRGS